ncbi:uncharacterized protein LOC111635588 [Centruroides sculpturatus]|uniref:uncharacterized protein LOC111635588 n=1 Tax=Centruroides sculpturatus TaxID=218467 RepID=UPI000C6DD100|nr:uncharacterized protein LOC111635588 [Centruroides sculpturatus]
MPEHLQERCCTGIVLPFLASGKVLGFDFVAPCQCTQEDKVRTNRGLSLAFKIYITFIEVYLWTVAFLFALRIYDLNLYCLRSIQRYGDYARAAAVTVWCTSLYIAAQFSILKRKKITIHSPKSCYDSEKYVIRNVHKSAPLLLLSLLAPLVIITPIGSVYMYAEIQKYENADTEAFVCAVAHVIWLFYLAGQIVVYLMINGIILYVIGMRLVNLSEEMAALHVRRNSLKKILQEIFHKHFELWQIIESYNDEWSDLKPILYVHFVYVSSFILYATLFVINGAKLKIIFTLISIIYVGSFVTNSYLLSIFTRMLYDNFTWIERLSPADLSLTFKLKMNDFLKRYGKTRLGFSTGGFIYVKRDFCIRVVSGLYSAFSTCVELSGILEKERKCFTEFTNSTSTNRTI